MNTVPQAVETAVILAAGMGTRLGVRGREMPKGFLRLGDQPIIQESLDRLTRAGIRDVLIVTGHLASFYQELAEASNGLIRTVHNSRYADSGSFYSLALALGQVDPPFLLLESDLIYETRAVRDALDHSADNVVLMSSETGSGDEVWVETDGDRHLVGMSKDRRALSNKAAGELVGITKIGRDLARALGELADRELPNTPKLEYEVAGLVGVASTCDILCLRLDSLLWAEIDDEKHLRRVKSSLYGLIQERD